MFSEKAVFLKKGIINYAEHVEKMVIKSMEGILERKEVLLHDVISNDEHVANKYEIDFDEICISYIAQYQPVAKNLRVVISAIKMSNDLERMADHAVNIAQNGLFLISRPFIKPFIDMPKMNSLTVQMIEDAIKSFVNEDIELAKNVLENDSQIDTLKTQIIDELSGLIEKNPKSTATALKLINIASNLERIADLSTNICEDVIYMAEGTVLKHKNTTA